MKVGTKSVLFGAHCFLIHPWFVARAWWILYGFPLDPRMWCAFFLHDIGYIGKPNMDGPEGERHPETGANIMRWWFGDKWGDLCLYHSRYYAKHHNQPHSKLCVADKLALALTPAWLYLPMVRATGELEEYLHNGRTGSRDGGNWNPDAVDSEHTWYINLQAYMRGWVTEHKNGKAESWITTRHAK